MYILYDDGNINFRYNTIQEIKKKMEMIPFFLLHYELKSIKYLLHVPHIIKLI